MNQLIESCEKTFAELLELLKKKNKDYAGDADSYKNFLDPELQAYLDKHGCKMDAVELGIRVRLKDKWSRLNTLLFSDSDPAVTDESFDDTLTDIIGYVGICKAWREYNKKQKPGTFIPVQTIYEKHLEDANEWPCICGHTKDEHCHNIRCGCGRCVHCQTECLKFELGC